MKARDLDGTEVPAVFAVSPIVAQNADRSLVERDAVIRRPKRRAMTSRAQIGFFDRSSVDFNAGVADADLFAREPDDSFHHRMLGNLRVIKYDDVTPRHGVAIVRRGIDKEYFTIAESREHRILGDEVRPHRRKGYECGEDQANVHDAEQQSCRDVLQEAP